VEKECPEKNSANSQGALTVAKKGRRFGKELRSSKPLKPKKKQRRRLVAGGGGGGISEIPWKCTGEMKGGGR